MRLFRRKAGWLIGSLLCVALCGSLVAVGFFHRALERSDSEIAKLRTEAANAVAASEDLAARQRASLEQVRLELAQAATARESVVAAIEKQAAVVAAQQAEIEQLKAERDQAVEAASEQAGILADQQAMLEQDAERHAQLTRERDQALAERDAMLHETRRALRELDADARTAMADVEKIIVATGLEPSRIVPEPSRIRRVGARGGPYIPWKAQVAQAEQMEQTQLHTLSVQLERLKSLRDIMVRMPLIAPVTHAILSDGFGYRRDPVNGGGARHDGLDLRAVRDSAIIAPAAGTVIAAGWDGAFGNMIQIDHGFGVISRYAHLARMMVRKGDVVAPNEQIGVVGATGRATGVHLHYEIWVNGQPRDPMRFLTAVSRPFAGFVRQ